MELFKDKESPLKILLATSALGMGADIPHIDQVVHLSPPSNIEGKKNKTTLQGIYMHKKFVYNLKLKCNL